MFDIGFSELVVIGVVALIVIGPERLPKVARTAGHLYGRLQRYVSTVKADISREVELDELRRAGQSFKESIESAASGVQQQATVVDDYLRDEFASVKAAVTEHASSETPGEAELPPGGGEPQIAAPPQTLQQCLPLDEPDQNAGRTPHGTGEVARSQATDKPA
ncbi:Sec-independent protein translocase protein TatB [Thiobacillus sedimenti]|uniref:Sec-independent protein translocase protein TatB n=1 Tax=Thiobacillus sedimenti TaxID=3110231 RepID=A0ABZ1CFR5_9PROT|nr:Sec-independent protein translocase protein TatB [Thiobacillus sp. SCUT-2]WRS38077.1 Sec-independent protein translocase protein TatB [Thiobacillus sp. SCUT-2]